MYIEISDLQQLSETVVAEYHPFEWNEGLLGPNYQATQVPNDGSRENVRLLFGKAEDLSENNQAGGTGGHLQVLMWIVENERVW